jgi:hypothetical protein
VRPHGFLVERSRVRVASSAKEKTRNQPTFALHHVTEKKTHDCAMANESFANAFYVSGELREFLDVPENAMLSRTEITWRVIQHIKSHNLANERYIDLDAKLERLLANSLRNDRLTFFNLQSHLRGHISRTPIVPPLPKVSPERRALNEELQRYFYKPPGAFGWRDCPVLRRAGPLFDEWAEEARTLLEFAGRQ